MGVIVMFVMQKNRRVGYALLGFLFILSIIASFIITEIYKIMPHMGIHGTEEFRQFWNHYYVKPYTRGSSYIVGMFGGILYVKLKSKKVKISRVIISTLYFFLFYLQLVYDFSDYLLYCNWNIPGGYGSLVCLFHFNL